MYKCNDHVLAIRCTISGTHIFKLSAGGTFNKMVTRLQFCNFNIFQDIASWLVDEVAKYQILHRNLAVSYYIHQTCHFMIV